MLRPGREIGLNFEIPERFCRAHKQSHPLRALRTTLFSQALKCYRYGSPPWPS